MYITLRTPKHTIKEFPDTVIQHYLDYYTLYSKSFWLLLLDEKLRRTELEIGII